MSTVGVINFEPVSDIMPVQRRDFPLADPTLANPNNAVKLYDGEWLTLNASYQLVRAAAIGTPGDPATVLSFPSFMEPGRYDRQAMAERKSDVLWLGDYEVDTTMYDAAAVIGGGAAITTVMQPLKVATITIASAGRNFVGLVGHGGAADTAPIVGYVTRLHTANGGKLRFRSGSRH